jgi:predicted CoA-substrate-specific enzyme activase
LTVIQVGDMMEAGRDAPSRLLRRGKTGAAGSRKLSARAAAVVPPWWMLRGIPMVADQAGREELLLGIDIGTANVKVVICTGSCTTVFRGLAPSRGHPLGALHALLSQMPDWLERECRIAVTGAGHLQLQEFTRVLSVNEILATAIGVREVFPRARTVIDLGGQFSKWILLGAGDSAQVYVADFSSNGLCAAGAGAFLEQQAGRLRLTLEELGCLAARARRGADIAGRCSVFAKSDMIHLQQAGTPIDEIALGLCQAMARTFVTGVMRGRSVELPMVLVGGGAANPGLVRAFGDVLRLHPDDLTAPAEPFYFGARGAARMALGKAPVRLRAFRDQVLLLLEGERAAAGQEPSSLPPLVLSAGGSAPLQIEDPPALPGCVKAYLGVDVGSVSTNLVLLGTDFQVLQGIYLPTQGRPVEALNEGMRLIQERYGSGLEILGVGSTGSGRHLAAKLMGADVVKNEITAQMVSALFFAPEVDTIFEIGGQDSKYIFVRDGNLADFEMNKICSGGTGSFLEEQAQRLGVDIVGEFADLALRSLKPCDLGTRCTVFMDSELVRAEERGAGREAICAGLAYSVARNYMEKVVASHPIGRHIMFQGGTASNAAVLAAFRLLLGRPVQVHPYNRISGALGAALLAARSMPDRTRFLGLQACAAPEMSSFPCCQCENRCQVNQVRAGARTVHFGDICERYSEQDKEQVRLPRSFPELFAARQELLERYLGHSDASSGDRPRIGMLRSSLNQEFLPLWVHFLRDLGYEPVLSGRTTARLLQEHSCGIPGEVCLPIRCAAAHARALLREGSLERVFVPAILECPHRGKEDQSHTCFYVQQLPDMLRVELEGRIVTAQFALTEGLLGLVEPVFALSQALDRSPEAVFRALRRARAHYSRYVAARTELGKTALAASFDRAAVVLGRPYNVHDPYLNMFLSRHLDKLGLPAIPWDLLPLDDIELDPCWETLPWHYNRDQIRTIELMRRDPRLFPIMVSSYGCGPDGFTVKHLEEMLSGRPRLLLEFDEHRGEAGLVTRLEAFADEIEEHIVKRRTDLAPKRLTKGPNALPHRRRFFIPYFSEHALIYAAVLRSTGFEAEVLPPASEETIRLGEAHSSGRECHPFSILSGDLIQLLRTSPPRAGAAFLIPTCTSPCLLRQYGDAFRILLERNRLAKIEIHDANLDQLGRIVGIPGLIRLYEGLLAIDILYVLASRLRAYEQEPGAVDRLFARITHEVAGTIESKDAVDQTLCRAATELWNVPRAGAPGKRPVVGITGDLFTRINAAGNAGLFHRLERMGCEVWPSPFFATMADLSYSLDAQRHIDQGWLAAAAMEGFSKAVLARLRRHLVRRLPDEVVRLAVELPVDELVRRVRPYLGPRTNYLILLTAAKIVDFLQRGAGGVINASGINCIVGVATASVTPAIRADFAQAPVIALVCGGKESPAQRIRLETFVHQVLERPRPAAA